MPRAGLDREVQGVTFGYGATVGGTSPGTVVPDWVDIARFALGGNGTSGSPWTGWDTNITWQAAPYYARSGFYSATASPLGWVTPGLSIRGDGSDFTQFTFTQAGDGFSILNNTYATNMHITLQDFGVKGTATMTNAFHFRNLHRSNFMGLKVYGGCTAAGMLNEGSVSNTIDRFSCDNADGGFGTAAPVNGIKLDQSGAGQPATDQNITQPRIGGAAMTGSGIVGVSTAMIRIYGGYSENGQNFGIEIQDTNNASWSIYGTDCEGNTVGGILLAGQGCSIYGGQTITGTSGSVLVPANALAWGIFGGRHDSPTVAAGAFSGIISGVTYNQSGGKTITDPSGVSVQTGNWNATLGTADLNTNSRDAVTRTQQVAVGGALTVTTNAITPTRQIHHVGAGLIKTINLPTLTSTGAAITNGYTLYIIPDAAYTYDATGNITLPAGGGTAVINKTMVFAWDGVKWSPSY